MKYILVAEDDELIQDVVGTLLTIYGYEYRIVDNGAEALRTAIANPPTLILLDIQMPIMDGKEFIKLYCERPGPHSPVIIMSAYTFINSILSECVQGYLVKPFGAEQLLEYVRQYAQNDPPGLESLESAPTILDS